jgi:ribosomal protein L22
VVYTRVSLVAYSSPRGLDPRRLVVLAVKVSQGRVRERGVEHYQGGAGGRGADLEDVRRG